MASVVSVHGSCVDVFGMGLLIMGEPSIGKSEAALGLVRRGHRLIADDVVKLSKQSEEMLEASGYDASRFFLELKGMGVINIAELYGMSAVQEKKNLDLVVKLEVWNDNQFYQSDTSLEETVTFLDVDIPFQNLPVTAGRDVVLFLETLVLRLRSKQMTKIERKGSLWQCSN